MKNIPYVKKYDSNGVLINPIKGSYSSPHPNRRQRNQTPERFVNNRKAYHLTVMRETKFKRVRQTEVDKNGKIKYILHYLIK